MIICHILLAQAPTARSDSPGATAGSNSANQALGRFGSAEGILGNAYNPLTSSASPMNTVDGATSFNAQIQCPSSREFVTVLLTPAGGGEADIMVGEDLDFDGMVDYTFNAPVNASGVCANGIISCEPGSWNSCRGYKWTANPAGQTGLTEVSITDLGGCYCINNSCGSNLFFARQRQILETVGGGVIGSIQGLSPRFTVTRARIDGTSILYHGQATAGCSAAGAGGSLPTAYYSQGTDTTPGLLLAGAGALEASAQAADPNSYYSLIQSSYSLASNPSTTSPCVIERVGSAVTNTYKFDQAATSGNLCTDHLVFARIHKVDERTYELQHYDTGPGLEPHWNCGGAFPWEAPIGSGSWHTLRTVTFPVVGANYRLTNAAFSMQNIGGPGCTTGSANLNGMTQGFDVSLFTGVVCPAGGPQIPSFTWSYLFEMMEDVYNEGISDGCAALAANSDCSLQEETVDGVLTYSNFSPTFIVPIPTCKTFYGSFTTFLECREWWRKERKYRCTTETRWDFSDAKKRVDRVTATATDNLTTMAYQDLRKNQEDWVTEDKSVTLNTPREDYVKPILACKTRKPKRKTDAAFPGQAAQYLADPDGWEFFYKKCDGNICPLDASGGEEIVLDCREINEFAEAATIMNILEQANKDMICSDGVKK